MATATLSSPAVTVETAPVPPLHTLLLARLASAKGVARAELVRDMAPFLSHRLSPAEQREALDGALARLSGDGLVCETEGRSFATPHGEGVVRAALGGKALPKTWVEVRDLRIVALALGLERESPGRLKGLAKPEGLRALIVQDAFDLATRDAASPSRLRTALAIVALERAFGNKIKGALASGKGLAPKAARLLAAQVSAKPRDYGTDSRLIAALAAEKAGTTDTSAEGLRLALIRRFLAPSLEPKARPPVLTVATVTELPLAAERAAIPEPVAEAPVLVRPAAAARPDLAGFARAVQASARLRADGWPGNRKAFISHVFAELVSAHPEWGLSVIEFKGMLAEAHRTGHVVLANADIKDKRLMKDFQESAIAYKNTVWHFVRVED